VNHTPPELDLIRAQLRAAIERDLHGHAPRVRVKHRRRFRVAIPTLAVLAAAAAAVLSLTVTATSPGDASAAARRALAATAAAPSGTMTTTVLHGGVTQTVDAARWNGRDIAFSPGVGPIPQLLLIGGGMYVQTSAGAWLHYASASDAAPKPLGGMVQLARDNITGSTPQQILALATHVQKTAQPDGTTTYTGTIPNSSLDPALVSGNDAITNMILGAQKRTTLMFGDGAGGPQNDLQLQMSVGGDGLVRRVSVNFQQGPAAGRTYTWSVTYSRLGTTPPITAPPASTDVPAGTLPPGTLPPNGGQPAGRPQGQTIQPQEQTITRAEQADYLRAAACIRSHGVPDFPDPTFPNGHVRFNIPSSIDANSPQAKSAQAACVNLIPPGLPYSSSPRTASPPP
jgi:hypothetical protein